MVEQIFCEIKFHELFFPVQIKVYTVYQQHKKNIFVKYGSNSLSRKNFVRAFSICKDKK